MALPNLLFIDTNIWLDFYRARNETGLQLLNHVEAISDKIIVNFQLEAEFKRNRQTAILEGMQELKSLPQFARLGIFSDAKATRVMQKSIKVAEKSSKTLKTRLGRVLENPAVHDPVYKVCQRIFHKEDELNLTRENTLRRTIRRKAFRRFFQGYPPRKKNDTSIGDAFNWEWMVHCANERKAGLVIVTRDSDYGVTLENKSYINDHLRQEFSERVSRKRKLFLHSRLSDALKRFEIVVSPQEEEAEKELVSDALVQRAHTSFSMPEVTSLFTTLPTVEFGNLLTAIPKVEWKSLMANAFPVGSVIVDVADRFPSAIVTNKSEKKPPHEV
jgi:PIN domain